MIEAIFLVRAFRATLPRFGATEPVNTGEMPVRRRISSTFKDVPGGQILGPTFDYTHRYATDGPNGTEGAVPTQNWNGEVWDDCDFNFGTATMAFGGWNPSTGGTAYQDGCYDSDWSTSYWHGYICPGPTKANVESTNFYAWFTDWANNTPALAEDALSDNRFHQPHFGTRP
jgi:hypothetical protein